MLTRESILHENFKQACLKASEDDTLYSTRFDSMPARVLKTETTEKLARRGLSLIEIISATNGMRKELGLSWGEALRTARAMTKAGLPYMNQGKMSAGFTRAMKAILHGDNAGLLFCGQSCGMVNDIPTCREVIERTVAEAQAALKAAKEKYAG
jgi:NAD(P)H-dependent flavin oxidoreductase YrpB (nitropropane dioxygenase family)